MHRLHPAHPRPEIKPSARAGTLAGYLTGNLSVDGMVPTQQSHTGRGCSIFLLWWC